MKKTRSKLLAVAMSLALVMNTLPTGAFAEASLPMGASADSDPPATGTDVAIESGASDEEPTTEETTSPSAPEEQPGPQGLTSQSGEDDAQGDNGGGVPLLPADAEDGNQPPAPASHTVTYAVEGGSFAEGTATTESIADGQSPTSVPTDMIPDSTHKDSGMWYQGDSDTPIDPTSAIITGTVTFTYKFDAKPSYTITVAADPTEGGTVAGGGQVTEGQETTVAATANAGYGFDGWYESTTLVSSDNPYTFTLTGDVSLTARFKKNTNLVAWDGRNAVVDRDASFRVSFGFNPSFEGMNSEYEKVILTWKGTQIGERDERDANLFHVKASDLQLGDNYLKLTYPGSDSYMPSSDSFTVTVVKKLALSLVDVSPETAPLGTPYTVSGRIVDENGNPLVDKGLYAYVQDAEGASTSSGYSATTGENGAFSFDVSANVPTSPSTINVKFTVSEDDDYKALAETRTISFAQAHTVTLAANPASLNVSLEGGGSYPAGAEITVKAEEFINGIDGFFRFEGWYASDTKVSSDVAYTFTVTGDISLTAKFKKIVVFQYTIPSNTVDLGEGIEIGDIRLENNGKNLPDEEHEKITLTRNGNSVGQWWNTTKPMFAVNPTELGVGKHTLTLSYPGSDEYFPASTDISVTVVKKLALRLVDFAPTVAAVNIPYTVSGRIVDENGDPYSGKSVTLSVQASENGANFNSLGSVTTDQNGAFSKEVSEAIPTAPGTRQIWVRADGDDSHKALDESPVVTFRQLPSRMKVTTIGDIEVNKEFTIEATLTDEEGAPLDGRQLIITVNDVALARLPQTDAHGKVTVAYTPNSISTLLIKATYTSSSNDTYAASEDEITEEVSLTKSMLTLTTDDDQYVYSEPVKISGKLTDGQGNAMVDAAIALSVNGKAVGANPPVTTDDKGEFSHTFMPDAAGTYTVKAEFAGIDGSIAGSTAEASFEVLKIKTVLGIDAQVDKTSLVVTVKRTAGATGGILVFVDDKEYPVEDFTAGEDGDLFTLTIDDITPGEHTIRASYAGDEHYTDAKSSPALIEVPLCYTVHFEPSPPQGWVVNGSMNDQDRVLDDKLRLPKCAFTFGGEDAPVFTGWNTKADGSGDAFADEDTRNITDEHGAVVTLYAIWDNPQITTNRLPEGRVGDAYSATLTQVGLAEPKWAISRGELPEGLSLDPDTGIITGTPERACTVSIRTEVTGIGPTGLLTITGKDLTVTIVPNITGITLDSDSAKKDYVVGDALDVTGLTLTVSKSNTSAETLPVTADMVTGFDSSKTGKQTLTVTYAGFTASFEVEVKAKPDPPAPAPVAYGSTKGHGGAWTKGSGETLAFTFKRSVDDDKTYGLFTGIEVDGKAVDKGSYTAEAGSVIVRLSPAYLETLPAGSHTIKALFEDGSAAADFTIAGEGGQPAGGDYHPVTWDPNGGTLSASTYPFEKTSERAVQSAHKGDAHEVLAAPARSGHTFLHWECDGKEYQPGQEFTVGERDLVFTARWKKNDAAPGEADGNGRDGSGGNTSGNADSNSKDGSGGNTGGDTDGKDGKGGNAGGDAGGNAGDRASGTESTNGNGAGSTPGSATNGNGSAGAQGSSTSGNGSTGAPGSATNVTASKASATGSASHAGSTAGTKSTSPSTGDHPLPWPGLMMLAGILLATGGASRRRHRKAQRS